jgi:hypothetical protein
MVSFEARGEAPARLDDALQEFLDLLVDRGGAVSASTLGDRYGATFSIDEPVESSAAVALGSHVFTALAEKSGLPVWPIVRAEALTFEEHDREIDTRSLPASPV